jgi:hypothetical protein
LAGPVTLSRFVAIRALHFVTNALTRTIMCRSEPSCQENFMLNASDLFSNRCDMDNS